MEWIIYSSIHYIFHILIHRAYEYRLKKRKGCEGKEREIQEHIEKIQTNQYIEYM